MITKRIEKEDSDDYLKFNANMYGVYLEVGLEGRHGDEFNNIFIDELDELEAIRDTLNKAINYHKNN